MRLDIAVVGVRHIAVRWATSPGTSGRGTQPARGIAAVIPEPSDQYGHRRNKGSHGGRPAAFHSEDYKGRNVVERAFNQLKQGRGLATCHDNTHRSTAAASSWPQS